MNLHKVFVYGTLKKGEPNYHEFSRKPGYFNFLSDSKTSEKFPLIIATKYNIPFLLHAPGFGHHVQGELYEVDDQVLAVLDELEDHPNFYVREEVDVVSMKDQSVQKAWTYFIKTFKEQLLQKEMIPSYTNHASFPRYVESEESTMEDLNNS